MAIDKNNSYSRQNDWFVEVNSSETLMRVNSRLLVIANGVNTADSYRNATRAGY